MLPSRTTLTQRAAAGAAAGAAAVTRRRNARDYGTSLPGHAVNGSWAGGVSGDGFLRHGVAFDVVSVVMNCPERGVARSHHGFEPVLDLHGGDRGRSALAKRRAGGILARRAIGITYMWSCDTSPQPHG